MPVLMQIVLVLLCCLLGQALSIVLPFPLPASVAAMILLLVALLTKRVRPAQLETAEKLFLKNLSLFLLPAGVSILGSLDVLLPVLVPLVVICVVTTAVTFLGTYFAAALIRGLQQRKEGKTNG